MKPIGFKKEYGIPLTILIVLIAISQSVNKGKDFVEFIIPEGLLLNWRFVAFLTFIAVFITWFLMNLLWKKEFDNHQKTRFEKENYFEKLRDSENKRLTDVITGVPNMESLKQDIEVYLEGKKREKQLQFILIDLKDFKKINDKYGVLKTNELLRVIARTIYKKMRRNEDMYRFREAGKFYRIHTGGDEFAFIIEGNQVEALGFINRLVKIDFQNLSNLTDKILGNKIQLSFHCALVEMSSRDNFENVIERVDECYCTAKLGKRDFTICWHPNDLESGFKSAWQKAIYNETRQLFEVLTMENKSYE